jgi:hypothetical protein
MKKVLCFATGLFLLVACSGGQSDDTTSTGGTGGAGGGYTYYICKVGEKCISTQMNCHSEPTDPQTGVLTCDGTKFVSTCEAGYFCSDDGSTPDYYPDCVSKFKENFTCDLTHHILVPSNPSGTSSSSSSSSSSTGVGGSGGAG